MDILSPDEEVIHDLVERYDSARLRLRRLWRERNAAARRAEVAAQAERRATAAEAALMDLWTTVEKAANIATADFQAMETQRLAYAKQVALATEALRKEHAEALAAAKQSTMTALESLDKVYGWLTAACAERDAISHLLKLTNAKLAEADIKLSEEASAWLQLDSRWARAVRRAWAFRKQARHEYWYARHLKNTIIPEIAADPITKLEAAETHEWAAREALQKIVDIAWDGNADFPSRIASIKSIATAALEES